MLMANNPGVFLAKKVHKFLGEVAEITKKNFGVNHYFISPC